MLSALILENKNHWDDFCLDQSNTTQGQGCQMLNGVMWSELKIAAKYTMKE